MAVRSPDLANNPLLPDEDFEKYQELRNRITATIKPNDIFEEFWINDLASQTWERMRYEAMSVELVKTTAKRALEQVLTPLVDIAEEHKSLRDCAAIAAILKEEKAEKWAHGFVTRNGAAIDDVQRLLNLAGLSWKSVQAEAMALRGAEFQRLNQMIAKAETRRAATLRAIERHRTGLGAQLNSVIEAFEQSECRDVGEDQVGQKLAA